MVKCMHYVTAPSQRALPENSPFIPNSILSAHDRKVLETISTTSSAYYPRATLVQHIGLSPSQPTHLFNEATDCSIVDMMINTRLKEAAKPLRIGEYSIQDIATQAGFNSPFHFSRRLRKVYGLNPTEYQSQHHESK